jgi:Outer membrane protein beta-barrel domain
MRTLAFATAVAVALPAFAQESRPTPPDAPPPPPPAVVPPPPVAAPAPPAYPPPYPPPYPPHPAAGLAQPVPQRGTWYIGFGVGTGAGAFHLDDGTRRTFADAVGGDVTSLFFNFKVGGTVSPRLLLGFDLSTLSTHGTSADVAGFTFDTSVQVTNLDAMVTFFPFERGLFLRGGLGLATLYVKDFGFFGVVGESHTRTGVGAVLGAGYAFWLARSFNLTLNLDLSAQSYGKSAGREKDSSAANLWLGFDWY